MENLINELAVWCYCEKYQTHTSDDYRELPQDEKQVHIDKAVEIANVINSRFELIEKPTLEEMAVKAHAVLQKAIDDLELLKGRFDG